MKKFLKWLLGLAAVGTGIGLIIAYFCKDSDAVSEYDCTEDMEEEDFDLDNDLKPVSERGYVHLNKAASDTADTEEEPSQETQATDTESGRIMQNRNWPLLNSSCFLLYRTKSVRRRHVLPVTRMNILTSTLLPAILLLLSSYLH